MRTRIGVLLVVVLSLGLVHDARAEDALPLPPSQPAEGPHGTDYPYPARPTRFGTTGLGGFTIYEPRDAAGNPPAEPVPVVLLNRGACVGTCSMNMQNNIMNAWRDHLAKKGNIVVFPHFQQDDNPELELANVAGALHMALDALRDPGYVAAHPELTWESDPAVGHAQPDLSRFGIAGHSRGSQMTSKLAARIFTGEPFGAGSVLPAGHTATSLGLPEPDWVLVIQPGPTSFADYSDVAAVPERVRMVFVVGEDDTTAGDIKARTIWAAASNATRDFVRVYSDRRGPWGLSPLPVDGCDAYGFTIDVVACASTNTVWAYTPRNHAAIRNTVSPAAQTGDLVADHFFPGGGSPLDVFALWRIAQGLLDCTMCPIAPDMGVWSDGVPVHPLCVTRDPDEPC